MQQGSDYQRGFQSALADAQSGWTRCWLAARQLADDAVYSPYGLTEEQQGYSDGLQECYCADVMEAGFLARPMPVFSFSYPPERIPRPAPPAGAEVRPGRRCYPGPGPVPAPQLTGTAKKERADEEKRVFMARFM